jgi:hypothetical protein
MPIHDIAALYSQWLRSEVHAVMNMDVQPDDDTNTTFPGYLIRVVYAIDCVHYHHQRNLTGDQRRIGPLSDWRDIFDHWVKWAICFAIYCVTKQYLKRQIIAKVIAFSRLVLGHDATALLATVNSLSPKPQNAIDVMYVITVVGSDMMYS